jgi:arylsulfatase A-like enzyme
MSALIEDLRDRNLLDNTLVVWMGEFGRSPQITAGGGRNHHPRAWSTVLAGGGIRAGQVIGRTDQTATAVTERPISVVDFMATICRVLGIDYTRNNLSPDGRPVRIVDDRNVTPIRELAS